LNNNISKIHKSFINRNEEAVQEGKGNKSIGIITGSQDGKNKRIGIQSFFQPIMQQFK